MAAPDSGRYQLTVNDTGIYLSVWPAGDGMPVSKAAVVKDLTGRGYNGFDESVYCGIDKKALKKLVQTKRLSANVICASRT